MKSNICLTATASTGCARFTALSPEQRLCGMRLEQRRTDESKNTSLRYGMADTLESKDLLDLAKLVSEMRHEQKEFARTGRFNRRESAKRLEAKVDESVGAILDEQSNIQLARLWATEPQ